MVERGKYIVVEGGEFAGKTTQLEKLKLYIEKLGLTDRFLHTREPGGTLAGEEMRRLLFFPPEDLSDLTALHIFTANRIHNWETQIKPALDSGIHVLSDRNWFSTLSYQGARGSVSEEQIIEATSRVLPKEYMHPDLAFVLTIPSEERTSRQQRTALQDGAQDTFEARDAEFHDKVTAIYHRTITSMGAVGIDGAQPVDVIHALMIDKFNTALGLQTK